MLVLNFESLCARSAQSLQKVLIWPLKKSLRCRIFNQFQNRKKLQNFIRKKLSTEKLVFKFYYCGAIVFGLVVLVIVVVWPKSTHCEPLQRWLYSKCKLRNTLGFLSQHHMTQWNLRSGGCGSVLKYKVYIKGIAQLEKRVKYWYQGVTNRCRRSWLTNSALVYEPKSGGRGELRGISQWVQLYTGAQINFGDLTPHLTYDWYHSVNL